MKKLMKNPIVNRIIKLLAVFIITASGGAIIGMIIGRFIAGLFTNTYTESGNAAGNIFGFFFISVIFIIIYAVFFIRTRKNKDLFASKTQNSSDIKNYFINCVKTTGKKEIILFAAYTMPVMLFNLFADNWLLKNFTVYISDITQLEFTGLTLDIIGLILCLFAPFAFFYEITSAIPFIGAVIGYLLNILFFAAGYAVCLRIIFRKWNKKWYIKKEDLYRPGKVE